MKWSLIVCCLVISQSVISQDNKLIHFIPLSFSNKFSSNIAPVLTIRSGDTVSTETIDAGGFDKNAVKRQHGGNPLTGPFFIENSAAGDVLAITLTNVSLNRSYAFTTETFVSKSLPKSVIKQLDKSHLVKWKLDRENGFAVPDTAYEHLENFKVPLTPFLGCIGVAPANKKNEILSFFSGTFGGNLDFIKIAKGATIYLPVFHDGAFFYIGDGHAAQGDGELAGNALETSMDVEFTIKLIKNNELKITYPRVEDSLYIMAAGTDKTLDDALKIATNSLLVWLQVEYHLSLQEATQVISTSIEYTIAEIADPDVEVVAKIKKEILKRLKKYN